MRTEARNAQIVKLTLEIHEKQAEKRRLLTEAATTRRPAPQPRRRKTR